MIIFDLDGTLADCEHRRHFVDPAKHPDYSINGIFAIDSEGRPCDQTGRPFKPDWKAFYEACDQDKPIRPVIDIFQKCVVTREVQIWSGRCESVRDKTMNWLDANLSVNVDEFQIKMRPIGDSTPDDELKERWLNERCSDLMTATVSGKNPVRHDISFVFDDRPKVIRMWQRRGIFVFNCCQHDQEF